MQTLVTCYNNNFSNCSTSFVTTQSSPFISQIDRYTYLPGVSKPSLSETKYNYGLLTEDKEFDFGATMPPGNNPVSDRVIQYGIYSSGSCTPLGKNLLNRPCSDTTTSNSTTLAQTTYQYDANGNALSITSLAGTSSLIRTFSYYGSGLINVATDVNGATTTYTYNDCNGSFPTNVASKINAQLTLNQQLTWDCTGEAETQASDPNNQQITYSYVDPTTQYLDPYWRVVAVTDPLQNITHWTYSPTTIEHSLVFNSNLSTVDVLSTADSQGRLHLSQTKQSPSSTSYDTVVQGYDSDGRPAAVGIPCVSTKSQSCTSADTTTTYDNLGREMQVTDGGGGYTSYNYAPGGTYNNDILVKVGPSVSGENAKQRQLEFDGLGRLTSVCEISSSLAGVGTCGQTTPQSGYWTRYKYDGLGHLIGVCQNTTQPLSVDCVASPSSGQQTRTYSYDSLGRLTSEANPESGTTVYKYDSDATCGTYNGDLVKRIDSNGNTTCFSYDALHRRTASTYSGPNSTANRYYVYDAATVNGQAMTNVTGRVAEAYTATCSTCTKLTDEGFSYTARGELSGYDQSSTHSGGYYYIPMTYWANGQLNTFGSFLSQGQYAVAQLDGEGRPIPYTA